MKLQAGFFDSASMHVERVCDVSSIELASLKHHSHEPVSIFSFNGSLFFSEVEFIHFADFGTFFEMSFQLGGQLAC